MIPDWFARIIILYCIAVTILAYAVYFVEWFNLL